MKNNEYFDLYCKIRNSILSCEIKEISKSLHNKFPHLFDLNSPYEDEPHLSKFVFRDKLVKLYAWAVTDPKALDEIVKVSKDIGIVEIGAGRGYWASILASYGVNVAAYDIWKDENVGFYHPVGKAGEKAILKHQDRALFLCWPPYATLMAYNSVVKYKGNTIIYIGEDKGGCNADDKFFDYVSNKFKLDSIIHMAKWDSLYDNLYIYRR